MSDNFRVVECLYTPSDNFCIYDYTKIAYLTGNFICVREIVSSDVRPNFIKLDDHFVEEKESGRYIGLVSFPNLLVLGVKSQTRDVVLNFFSVHQEHQLKVTSELAKKCESDNQITYEMHQSLEMIYILVHRDCDTEIIAVKSSLRHVVGRGFISGQFSDFKIKTVQNQQMFSYYSKQTKQIVELQLLALKNQENMFRIAEKRRISIGGKQIFYCWSQEQLIVGEQNEVKVYLQGREMQGIRNLKSIKMIKSISGGFFVVCGNGVRVYKKAVSVFDFKGQYSLQFMPSSMIQLSPQEDLLAFYNDKNNAIYYALNWEVSESNSKAQQMKLFSIEQKKEKEIKTYNSSQALFAVTTGSNISIYSPVSYHCYLEMGAKVRQISNLKENKKMKRSSTLVSEKMLNEISEGEPIETIGIHPNRPIAAVAFKNIIRIYFVLYNEFKVAKQIQLSHCKQIGFNNSGSVMYAKLGGKQGSKIYLYNSLSNFECIQILNTSRPVQQVVWTPSDTALYAVHSNGYYTWNLTSFFKQRYDSTLTLNFEIKGAQIYGASLILWGQRNIVQLDFQHNVMESHKLGTSIQLLLVQSGNVIFQTTSGFLHRCKSVNQIDVTAGSPGFRVQTGSKIYKVKGNTLLCLNGEGHILCLQWGGEDKLGLFELVTIERKKLIKFQETYQKYEQQIRQLYEQMQLRLQIIKEQFLVSDNKRKSQFQKQVADRELRYLAIRQEKIKVEEAMQENMQIREQETLQYVKQLERIYERKIAIITNKLLTSQELGFRNNLLAKENLVDLEQKHSNDIHKIRGQYGKALEGQLSSFSDSRQEVLTLKKDYETRLAELELENQELIKRFQNLNEANVVGLKKNVVNLQLKFSQAVSQKFNLQKNVQSERIMLQQLCSKNEFLSERLSQETSRAEQLLRQSFRLQNQLIEKGQTINCLQQRIVELQKSNQIFKYRIVEMKNVNDPKQEEILKLKDNMIELQEEYQKISKRAHQNEQTISLLRKDNIQLKNALSAVRNRQNKLDKSYATMTDRLRDITKSPIQEIRKMLLKLLEEYQRPGDIKGGSQSKYHDSPLEQLNRAREHLEVCLKEAVDNSKKNEKQKQTQIRRKNRENSQLLKQINDLRVKVVELETQIKDKQLELQEFKRDGKSTSAMKVHKQRSSTDFETEGGRNKTRESFFQKSLFRGHWKEKRLKTEQGSRKKSTQSFVRNDTNHLYIESKSDQVDELRRVLDQKETIIKQLINKIHKLS